MEYLNCIANKHGCPKHKHGYRTMSYKKCDGCKLIEVTKNKPYANCNNMVKL